MASAVSPHPTSQRLGELEAREERPEPVGRTGTALQLTHQAAFSRRRGFTGVPNVVVLWAPPALMCACATSLRLVVQGPLRCCHAAPAVVIGGLVVQSEGARPNRAGKYTRRALRTVGSRVLRVLGTARRPGLARRSGGASRLRYRRPTTRRRWPRARVHRTRDGGRTRSLAPLSREIPRPAVALRGNQGSAHTASLLTNAVLSECCGIPASSENGNGAGNQKRHSEECL